jgi:hypothetical protein
MPTVAASKTSALEPVDTALNVWRAVEAQHRVSTMALVDTLAEQELLENMLDAAKPALNQEVRGLHWLLSTPFRYPPLPSGSRFRAAIDPGVFYGAEERRTACAELGYWRWRFLMDSPSLDSLGTIQQTVFRSAIGGASIDLREPPLKARRKQWTDPVDYRACQQLAREARSRTIAIVRYESVRDPMHGGCAAVLTPHAFTAKKPKEDQTWTLAVFKQHVFWRRDSIFEDESFEFAAADWL